MQTGAWALLPAALAALLYGLVHAFDLAGRNRSVAVAQPESEEAPGAVDDAGVLPALTDQPLETAVAIEAVEPVEPVPPRKSRARRTKAPRKGADRRASAPGEAKATEPEPTADNDAALPVSAEEIEVALPMQFEEESHVPLAPLFEPEPFVRQQRTVFGRKAG
jgi:hypothetical protein